jgi:type I restriction enzyme S subunit
MISGLVSSWARRNPGAAYTDVYYNATITSALAFTDATASESQVRQFTIQPGDVLITKDSETRDDIAVPAYVEDVPDDVLRGYHMAVIRPDASCVYPRFLYWTLASDELRSRFGSEATGVTRFGFAYGLHRERADSATCLRSPGADRRLPRH